MNNVIVVESEDSTPFLAFRNDTIKNYFKIKFPEYPYTVHLMSTEYSCMRLEELEEVFKECIELFETKIEYVEARDFMGGDYLEHFS